MTIRIDPSDAAPLYLQIVDRIRKSVAAGVLKPDEPVPSVRQLALELTINPNTVARAYLELEHQGVLTKRQGQGTYIATQALDASRRERRQLVSGLIEKAIAEAASFGMSGAEIDDVYRKAMDRLKMDRSKMENP